MHLVLLFCLTWFSHRNGSKCKTPHTCSVCATLQKEQTRLLELYALSVFLVHVIFLAFCPVTVHSWQYLGGCEMHVISARLCWHLDGMLVEVEGKRSNGQ